MSRSFGGTSLTTSPPIAISPSVMSSRPGDHAQRRRLAAARRPDQHDELLVGDVEIDAAHRLDLVVALHDLAQRHFGHVSTQPFGRAGGQAGDVVVHQEGVDDERRRGAEQRAGHDLPPVEHVALDQRRDDADRQHQLIGRCREGQRIEELRPGRP